MRQLMISVAATAALALAAPCQAQTLRMVTEETFVMRPDPASGHATGVFPDILLAMAEHAQISVTLAQYPWRRAFLMAETEPNTCQPGVGRIPEWEDRFRWIGPLATGGGVDLYGARDRSYHIQSVEDVARQGLVVAVEQYDLSHTVLSRTPNITFDFGGKALGARKLSAGRVDLWAIGRLSAPYTARLAGVSNIEPVLRVATIDIMIACNRDSDAAALVKLQAALTHLRATGVLNEVERRYRLIPE